MRTLIAAATLFVAIVGFDSAAQAQAGAVVVIREFAETIGVVGDSLGKLADGFDKLIGTGTKTYDMLAARKARSHLVDLNASITQLMVAQHAYVAVSIDEYLDRPSPAAWAGVTDRLKLVLDHVVPLLAEVKAERSDFVLTPGYEQMFAGLTARQSVLEKLIALPPPATPEELAALKDAGENYKVLIENLGRANAALAKYVQDR